MQPQEGPLATHCFNDEIGVQDQIYEPLTIITKADIKKQIRNTTQNQNFAPLFSKPAILCSQRTVFNDQLYKRQKIKIELEKDLNISKVIENQKQKNSKASSSSKSSNTLRNGEFSFNYHHFISFNETPIFKQQLLSPLSKFYRTFNHKIRQLYKLTNKKERYRQTPLTPSADPTLYKNQIGFFFTGLAASFKNKGCLLQSLFFYHLAVYCQPFNLRIWEQYCEALKKIGYWKQAKNITKTAFLFNPNAELAESYFLCGDKANALPHEMRGLLSSLKEPEKLQKAIIQSAKYQLKHRKTWRGFLLLNLFCQVQQYKSNICQSVILLAKFLQFFQIEELAMKLLTKSIDQKHSKYQAFILYFQLLLRKYQKGFDENNIQLDFFTKNINKLAPETRYRICLDVAEGVKNNSPLRKLYYQKAVQMGFNNCPQIVNQKRVRRHIYLSILSNLSILPNKKLLQLYKKDDHLHFLANKARYIRGQPLQIIEFQDWKYYLHYALGGNLQIIQKAYKTYNQGRILAQYLHAIRLKHILKANRNLISILKLWRVKIDQAPKSGQLLCEGGRIYISLWQYQNAKKCLVTAIHFTPQYGDSFFELLKILLLENSFLQVNQLRKNFIMSEPFYGNVFSFLKLSEKVTIKLSLTEIWSKCQFCIKQELYSRRLKYSEIEREKQKKSQKFIFLKSKQNKKYKETTGSLTACQIYNKNIMNPNSPQIRQKLFLSYELIQNKFSK